MCLSYGIRRQHFTGGKIAGSEWSSRLRRLWGLFNTRDLTLRRAMKRCTQG